MNIKVSVCVPTYNQEGYIRNTILSIAAQKTNFLYEILVADDCSTDNTYEVCVETAKVVGVPIRIIRNEINQGLLHNLFDSLFMQCSGEYIAICAGDDIWNDVHKLQKQVNLLDNNNLYSCVHTGFYKFYENSQKSEFITVWNSPLVDGYGKHYAKYILNEQFSHFPVGSSFVFRSLYLTKYRDFIKRQISSPFGMGEAMILFPLFAIEGKFGFLPEPLMTYRVQEESLSHTTDLNKQTKFKLYYLFQKLSIAKDLKLGVKYYCYLNLKILKFIICYTDGCDKKYLIESYNSCCNSDYFELNNALSLFIKSYLKIIR